MRLVYSLVTADEAFRDQLSFHLRGLVQDGSLTEWSEQLVPAGADLAQERRRAWQAADILLLLLSADYLAADIFSGDEMQAMLERQQSAQVRVIPLLGYSSRAFSTVCEAHAQKAWDLAAGE